MEREGTLTKGTRNGRLLFRLLRPIISVALLFFLLRSAGISEAWALVAGSDLPLLGVAVLLVIAAVAVSAYKWQWLLIAQGVQVPLSRLFSSYLVGLFFNNFLPTNIGGDVVRIHDIARRTGRTAEAAASVIGERLLAALALGITAGIGLLLSYQVSGGFTGIVIAVLVISTLIVALFASPRAQRALGRWIRLPDFFSLRQRLSRFAAAMALSLRNPWIVLWVIVLSMVFHSIVVLFTYYTFLALGASVPLVYCFLFVPIISAIQMLPISVSGFGVREGAYVYFFGWVGLSVTQAVTASLMFWALVALVSLAGGAIFAVRK